MAQIYSLHQTELKVVVLEAPYDSLEDPEAQEMFGKLMALRLRGYGGKYDYGIMPVDSSDFIATHLAVCKVDRTGLTPIMTPIMAYKSVTEPKCQLHRIPFSGLQLPVSAGAKKSIQAVQEIIDRSKERQSLVAYDGGWTMDPNARKNRILAQELKNLFTCIQVNHYQRYGKFDLLCGGLLRFQTEQLFSAWGYKPLQLNGESLGAFANPSLGNEPILMMHGQEFSPYALDLARKYQAYWEDRVAIGHSIENATALSNQLKGPVKKAA
jgi:hypothetical protein